jgi:hypothetical protein
MFENKFKALRIFVVFAMIFQIALTPISVQARTISDRVDKAIDNIEDLEDDLLDLEDLIDDSYGPTILSGDKELQSNTTVYKADNLYIKENTEWASTKTIYLKSGVTADTTTLDIGFVRVTPFGSFLPNTEVFNGDSDLTTPAPTLYKAENLYTTASTSIHTTNYDVYKPATVGDLSYTLAQNDTRITTEKIISESDLLNKFGQIFDILEDGQDELKDLKGYIIPTKDLDDLEDAIEDLITAAEDVRDIIEDNIHSNLDDLFEDEDEDFESEVDDVLDDLEDVRTGTDTSNKNVEDFIDDIDDIEKNVKRIGKDIPNEITKDQDVQSIFGQLDDELDEAIDVIDDLKKEQYNSTDRTKIESAWDDLVEEFENAIEDLDDAVSDGNNAKAEDEFDDLEDDFLTDLEYAEYRLVNILDGEDSEEISRKTQKALDKLKDYRDEIRDENRILLTSYGEKIEEDDEDWDSDVSQVTNLFIQGLDESWASGETVYFKPTSGSTATTVETGDYRVTNYGNTYKAGTYVLSSDQDRGTFTITSSDTGNLYINGLGGTYQLGKKVYKKADGSPLSVNYIRVTHFEIIYSSELQDIFRDLKDIMNDTEDELKDLRGENLNDSEIVRIENAYNRIADKIEDFMDDIDSYVHSTLSDDFDRHETRTQRQLDDLADLVDDIKNGTNSTVAERVKDFEDELNEIEDEIYYEIGQITNSINEASDLYDKFGIFSDLIEDIEDEIEDLEGYSYNSNEKSRVQDAFDDIEDAIEDAIDHIEDKIDTSLDENLDDYFDDEETDLSDEVAMANEYLTAVLSGKSTNTKNINKLIDKLNDAKDDLDDVYKELKTKPIGSVDDKSSVRRYSGDIQDGLDDAINALERYEETPTALGVSRIKTVISSIEDKMDDAIDELENKLADDDRVEDTFDDEEEDIDDKFAEVEKEAEIIYDRYTPSPNDDEDDDPDNGDNGDGQGDNYDIDFTDVSSYNVFKDEIETLASLGIIKGYNDGTFRPNNQVTRGEFLKIVAGASGVDVSDSSGSQRFTDVPTYHTFYDWVDYAASQGYVSGYSNGTFRPDDFITRFEAIVIILRFQGSAINQNIAGSQFFIDVTSPALAQYIDTAFELEIINGYPDNTFRPNNNITRGETAKIAVNAFS